MRPTSTNQTDINTGIQTEMKPFLSESTPSRADNPDLLELERRLREDTDGACARELRSRIDRLGEDFARRMTAGGAPEVWQRWQTCLQACVDASIILTKASQHYSQQKARA